MALETLGVLSSATAPARRTRSEAGSAGPQDVPGRAPAQTSRALEIALLRRSLAGVSDATERCGSCARTMLLGERVYEYPSGAIRCALCRERERSEPAQSHTVRGPEHGHSIRVIDRRSSTVGR